MDDDEIWNLLADESVSSSEMEMHAKNDREDEFEQTISRETGSRAEPVSVSSSYSSSPLSASGSPVSSEQLNRSPSPRPNPSPEGEVQAPAQTNTHTQNKTQEEEEEEEEEEDREEAPVPLWIYSIPPAPIDAANPWSDTEQIKAFCDDLQKNSLPTPTFVVKRMLGALLHKMGYDTTNRFSRPAISCKSAARVVKCRRDTLLLLVFLFGDLAHRGCPETAQAVAKFCRIRESHRKPAHSIASSLALPGTELHREVARLMSLGSGAVLRLHRNKKTSRVAYGYASFVFHNSDAGDITHEMVDEYKKILSADKGDEDDGNSGLYQPVLFADLGNGFSSLRFPIMRAALWKKLLPSKPSMLSRVSLLSENLLQASVCLLGCVLQDLHEINGDGGIPEQEPEDSTSVPFLLRSAFCGDKRAWARLFLHGSELRGMDHITCKLKKTLLSFR